VRGCRRRVCAGRGLFDVLQMVEFALEAGECVEDAGVVVAAFFEEGFAVVEGHPAGTPGIPADSVGRIAKNMRERSFRMAQALSIAEVLAFFAFSIRSTSRVSFVDALVAEADAEVVGGNLFKFVGSSKMTAAASGRMPASGRWRPAA